MAFNDAQVLDAETKAAQQMARFNGEPLIAPDANAPLDPYAPQPEISRTPIDPYSPAKLAEAEAAKFGAVIEAPIAQADPGSVAPQGAAQPVKPVAHTGVTPDAETAATAKPGAIPGLPAQRETLANPDDVMAAGVTSISEGAADNNRADQYEAQALKDTDNDGVIDAAEEAAAVSGIMDDWKMEDAKIMADVGGKLKTNLEALQKQQEDIQMRYDQTFEEVANTYINPAELWDKGGAGAKIGMAGGAFLDTWFAMKGWNVPSFSATWDKAVEGNVRAQVSKLEQGNKKLAGFDRLWQMASTLARTREDQIDITKDLLKANALGQYLARMKPYNSLQAIRDKEMAAAKIARETGKTKQAFGERMIDTGIKLREQRVKDAEFEIKRRLAENTINQGKKAAAAGGAGAGARGRRVDGQPSTGDTHGYLTKVDKFKFAENPEVAAAYAKSFGKLDEFSKNEIFNHLIGDKKSNYKVFYTIESDGTRKAAGAYDLDALKGKPQEENLRKFTELTSSVETLQEVNRLMVDVMVEAKRNGVDLHALNGKGLAGQWFKNLLGNPGAMTPAQRALDAKLKDETLKKLHELSGGAVTESEGVRFERYLPTGAFAKDGSLRDGISAGMKFLAKEANREVDNMGNGTGAVHYAGSNPALDIFFDATTRPKLRTGSGLTQGSAEANAIEAPPAPAEESSVGANDIAPSYISKPHYYGIPMGGEDTRTAQERGKLSMTDKTRELAIKAETGEDLSPNEYTRLENHGSTIVAGLNTYLRRSGGYEDADGILDAARQDILDRKRRSKDLSPERAQVMKKAMDQLDDYRDDLYTISQMGNKADEKSKQAAQAKILAKVKASLDSVYAYRKDPGAERDAYQQKAEAEAKASAAKDADRKTRTTDEAKFDALIGIE